MDTPVYVTHHGRQAVALDSGRLRALFLPGGGHLGALALASGPAAGVNPLWEVPWPSMEPAAWRPERDLDAYGGPPEGRLLASIMGHNLCLDFFGPPGPDELAAGLTVHGEAGVAAWRVESASASRLIATASLPYAKLAVRRTLSLAPGSAVLAVETEVTNEGPDRKIGWQEHVTLGAPFLEGGATVIDADATASRTDPGEFAAHHRLAAGQDFTWPHAPARAGGTLDVRTVPPPPAGDFTASLMDPAKAVSWFAALHPGLRLACVYLWRREDFPWLGMWDEQRDREALPWAGQTLARGLEFGLSPFAHGKAAMESLGSLFGVPVLRRLPAGATRAARFRVLLATAPADRAGVAAVNGDPGGDGPVRIDWRPGGASEIR